MRVGTLGIGGGGRNRTAVRRYSRPGTTCLAHRLVSPCGNTACEAHRRTHPLDLGHGWRVAAAADPVIMTLHPRAQAQVGSGLGLKRPERRRRRWRLIVCRWINEESCPLGMRRAISQPPSKPMHPRDREFVSMESFFRSTGAVWGAGEGGSSPPAASTPVTRPCCGGAWPAVSRAPSRGRGRPRACRGPVCPWRGRFPASPCCPSSTARSG